MVWGNDGTFGNNLTSETLHPIFNSAMKNRLNLWDTTFAYGMGISEKVLSEFIKELPRNKYLISDKFTPQCVDPSMKIEELGKYYQGKNNIPLIGVSNHNLNEIIEANNILKKYNLKLLDVQSL